MKRQQEREICKQKAAMLIALVLAVTGGMIATATVICGDKQKRQESIQEPLERVSKMQEKKLGRYTFDAAGWETILQDIPTGKGMETKQRSENRQDKYAVFEAIPEEWGDDADGFVFYEIPEEYSRTGGYFPEKMQVYTYCVCEQYGVRYDLVVALIEKESGYTFDKVGDDGNSIGYMQIYEEWHRDRMERLNVTDLKNPYQNVLVGIDYLSELIERYGTIQDALAAYNYGEQGAKQHLWKNGIYVYEYNQTIMSRMKEIGEELERNAGD